MTGCSAGIGKQVAIYFAKEGAQLVLCARRKEKLAETVCLCEEAGAQVLALPCDVTNYADLEKLVQSAIDRFGKLDVLINNVGDAVHGKTLLELTLEDARYAMEANYFACWNLMHLCYPHLKACGQGSIVNICSGAGVLGMETQGALSRLQSLLTFCRVWAITGNISRATLVTFQRRAPMPPKSKFTKEEIIY